MENSEAPPSPVDLDSIAAVPKIDSRSPPLGAKRFALCAGEASGDRLGAGLVDALRRRFPEAEFAGIGGDAMRAAGLDPWFDSSELAVMGLAEVLSHLPRLLSIRRAFRQRVLAWQPEVFIGIDAPDFNLGVERWLKRRGMPTVHYVSPSVWAWRENRVSSIGRSADRVLCLFPMEPAIYAGKNVDARYVGHPLADAMPLDSDRAAARAALEIPFHDPVLALLPGSRVGEISRMLPVFLAAAERVAQKLPGLHVLIAAANSKCASAIRAVIEHAGIGHGGAEHVAMEHAAMEHAAMEHAANPSVNGRRTRGHSTTRLRLLDGQAQQAMVASDVVLLASGTAALQAMLAKRPMVIGHRIAPTTYRIVQTLSLLKTRNVSLPNILAGETLIPEFLQDACTPENLAAAVLHWFGQPEAVAALRPRFRAIHETLRRGASERAAQVVAEMLEQPGIANRGSGIGKKR